MLIIVQVPITGAESVERIGYPASSAGPITLHHVAPTLHYRRPLAAGFLRRTAAPDTDGPAHHTKTGGRVGRQGRVGHLRMPLRL